MSPYLEFEGKIIEKAVQKACETLNVPREKLKYDVISYGSSGIFGLVGVKKAKIRVASPELPAAEDDAKAVSKRDPAPPCPCEPANRESEESDSGRARVPPCPCGPTKEDDDPDEGFAEPFDEFDESQEDSEEDDDWQDEEEAELPEADRDDSPDSADSFSRPDSGDSPMQKRNFCTPDPASLAAASELGRAVLQRIVDFITADAEVSVRETPERIFFNIQGGNTAVLIGKRGQTLEAVQYIVEKVINKNNAQRIRIQIDAEGYLDSRQSKLEGLAARLSEKAKRIGKPVTIGQLNAHDRRIVHIALKDDTGVRTQSMGEGFYRKLVIFPQKRFFRRKESGPPEE